MFNVKHHNQEVRCYFKKYLGCIISLFQCENKRQFSGTERHGSYLLWSVISTLQFSNYIKDLMGFRLELNVGYKTCSYVYLELCF